MLGLLLVMDGSDLTLPSLFALDKPANSDFDAVMEDWSNSDSDFQPPEPKTLWHFNKLVPKRFVFFLFGG